MGLSEVSVFPAAWTALAACHSDAPPLAPNEADRAIALTAQQLAPHLIIEGAIDPEREEWRLEHDPNGTWTLGYDYADDHLVVSFTAVRQATTGGADWAHVGFGLGRAFVEGTDGVALVPVADALAWGDSDCELIRTSGIDVGYVCRGKKDRLAFMITVAGVSPIGDASPAKALAEPLAAFDRWTPDAR